MLGLHGGLQPIPFCACSCKHCRRGCNFVVGLVTMALAGNPFLSLMALVYESSTILPVAVNMELATSIVQNCGCAYCVHDRLSCDGITVLVHKFWCNLGLAGNGGIFRSTWLGLSKRDFTYTRILGCHHFVVSGTVGMFNFVNGDAAWVCLSVPIVSYGIVWGMVVLYCFAERLVTYCFDSFDEDILECFGSDFVR